MFTIRTAAFLVAVAVSSPVVAQTPADLQRLTGLVLSTNATPTAPITESFSAQDVARLAGAASGHSSAPRFQLNTAFGAQDLARLMDVGGAAGLNAAHETFATAAASR